MGDAVRTGGVEGERVLPHKWEIKKIIWWGKAGVLADLNSVTSTISVDWGGWAPGL